MKALVKYEEQHVFDVLTDYCVKCGQSGKATHGTRCSGGGNVVGISHLVRVRSIRRLDEAVEAGIFGS